MRQLPVFACLLLTLPLHAQDVIVESGGSGSSPRVIDMPELRYPGGNIRPGQEAWVRMSFVVDAGGRAIEPLVIDATGGAPFEQAAREASREWLFEAPAGGLEAPLNHVDLVFEVDRGRGKATRNFMRRYARIVEDLRRGATDKAASLVTRTVDVGGWNLYETTMLMLMAGRVAAETGDPVTRLEYYRRALGVSRRHGFLGRTRREVLADVFDAELERGQLGLAKATLGELKARDPDDADTQARAARLDVALGRGTPLTVEGRIYNPCDCTDGVPLWRYEPVYRQFSFEVADGNVDSFEARCRSGRLRAAVETGRSWQLPAEWGRCELYVFGEDGAGFRLVEGTVE